MAATRNARPARKQIAARIVSKVTVLTFSLILIAISTILKFTPNSYIL